LVIKTNEVNEIKFYLGIDVVWLNRTGSSVDDKKDRLVRD